MRIIHNKQDYRTYGKKEELQRERKRLRGKQLKLGNFDDKN